MSSGQKNRLTRQFNAKLLITESKDHKNEVFNTEGKKNLNFHGTNNQITWILTETKTNLKISKAISITNQI